MEGEGCEEVQHLAAPAIHLGCSLYIQALLPIVPCTQPYRAALYKPYHVLCQPL